LRFEHHHGEAHVGTTYKRALETNFSGLLAPFQPVPPTLQHCSRSSTIIAPSTAYGDDDAQATGLRCGTEVAGRQGTGLESRKVQQLGELVISTGADALTADELAGALIVLAETKDAGKREAWAKRGAAFFQSRSRRSASKSDRDTGGDQLQPDGAQPASSGAGAT
jgi:hypothetical protein